MSYGNVIDAVSDAYAPARPRRPTAPETARNAEPPFIPRYSGLVAAKKIAISLDSELYEMAKAQADEEGMSMSAWLADAAKARIRLAILARGVAEDAAEFGEIAPETVEEVHRPAYVSATRKPSA